jgi:hypothetical protein
MRHRWAALVVVLAFSMFVPRLVTAQADTTKPPKDRNPGFSLGQNYPNPFNPETRIPFAVGDPPTCTDSGRQHVVSLKVFNLLAQLVAVPVLQGGPEAGQPLNGIKLSCGQYTAYWNGNYLDTSREVASGVYLYRLEVDGKVIVKKMFVAK